MTFKDLIRSGAKFVKAQRPRIRVWKIDALKLGYVSIPKAASSSIRTQMISLQAEREGDRIPARISLPPARLKQLQGDVFLFSFVRNPLTRLYSCYRDKVVNSQQRRARCNLSPYGIEFGMSFEEFVQRVAEIPDKYADQHFRSFSSFLLHKGEPFVDYVGRFEHFAEDWKVITDRFGIPAPPRLRRISGPPAPMASIPLSAKGLAAIMTRYTADLDTFGYREPLETLAREKSLLA